MEIDKDLNISIELKCLRKLIGEKVRYRIQTNGKWEDVGQIAKYQESMFEDDKKLIKKDILRLSRIVEEKNNYLIELKEVN